MDELVYSVYLSSELIVIDSQTVDGPGVLSLMHLVLPVKRHHLVAYLADVQALNIGGTIVGVPRGSIAVGLRSGLTLNTNIGRPHSRSFTRHISVALSISDFSILALNLPGSRFHLARFSSSFLIRRFLTRISWQILQYSSLRDIA
jgi:hypothetical protein